MQITAVTKSKKVRDLLSVYVDNRYSFSIKEEDYLALGLYSKTDITQDEIDRIKSEINRKYARNTAIKYLALKLRTEKDVKLKLESEGFDASTISDTISELKAMGYINDMLYVQKFLYDRSKLKPKSRKMLIFELKNKGVPEDIIQSVIKEYTSDDIVVAENLLRKKFGKYDLKDDIIFKRAYAFLRHRGFDDEIVMPLLEKYRNKRKKD